tara:strand:- start:5586 stop:6899 length:1314 start_codon:yes stop_codon:yes gene_type:complete
MVKKNKNKDLWKRAKKIIPNGNMLLSKNPDQFIPDIWPTYYSKASGVKIWDLEGNLYKDFSIMGVGTNILGYANREVDLAVKNSIKKSNMSTFNCPEEVYLAEELIKMHPWSDMVKFARTGGEANTIAIRIARAATANHTVAVCGYHGWHDWYLAANLSSNKNLDNHLLPGLKANGVPRDLKNSIYTFEYNKFDELKKLVMEKKIGIIKMEVSRSEPPKNDFLLKVRKLCNQKNIILIFDECTSGFRETYGGLHKKYKVNPDMAIFGKAIGNGYALTAIIGKKEIMENSLSTFISSTFWTERIGSVASLKTLEIMKREKTWNYITNLGKKIKNGWKEIANNNNINIKISGLDALPLFTFESNCHLEYKTYLTQEMLKKGLLASNTIYVSTAHDENKLKDYFSILDETFNNLSKYENGSKNLKFLTNKKSKQSFKRLN